MVVVPLPVLSCLGGLQALFSLFRQYRPILPSFWIGENGSQQYLADIGLMLEYKN